MTDPWLLELTPPARRQLRLLPEKVAIALVELMTGPLLDSRLRITKPLHDDLDGLSSARRGDYRVIVELDAHRRTVVVVRVAHRSQAYRPS